MLVSLHLIILGATLIGIIFADREGYLWIRGKKETLAQGEIQMYHWWVWAGLSGMLLTGIAMFWPLQDILLVNKIFIIKMMAVSILVINAFAIGDIVKIATTRTFGSLSFKEKIPLYASGMLSVGCWITSIILGFFVF